MRACLRLAVLGCVVLVSNVGVFGQTTCVPAPSGLQSWWPGDGDATDIADGNHGTPKNGVTFATGQVDDAFSLDGVDDYIVVGDGPETNLLIGGGLTLEAWVNPQDFGNGNIASIVTKWGQSANKDTYLMSLIKGDGTNGVEIGVIRVVVGIGIMGNVDSGLKSEGLAGVIPHDGTWTHVAMTYDTATALEKIYVNGVEVASDDSRSGTLNNDPDLDVLIGREDSSKPRPFKGLIDEVSLYNRALSASEILAIYNAGSAGKCKVITVEIDIKPGTEPNCFNNNGNGVIPVAILGSADFNATEVDPDTVMLESMVVKVVGKSEKLLAHIDDVNEDGFDDLLVQIEDDDGVFEEGDTTATLTGELFDGTAIEGTDSICIVPGGGGSLAVTAGDSAAWFRRGDSNADGATNVSDPLFTLNYLFAGGQAPACRDAADADDDGLLSVSDAAYTLSFLFDGASGAAGTLGNCAPDWTADELDCQVDSDCAAGD